MSFIKFLMEQQFDAKARLDQLEDRTALPQEDLFLVPGIGQMTREQARQRAVSKIDDIARRAQDPNVEWSMIVTMLKDSGLLAYAKALATRHE